MTRLDAAAFRLPPLACDHVPDDAHDHGNDFDINVTAVESVLRRTPIIGVGEYRCPIDHPQFAGGGPQKCPFIVFPHSSVRILTFDERPVVCTPNTVNLYNVGDIYARQAISREGALCDWIAVAPHLLREIGAHYDSTLADEPQRIFDRSLSALAPTIYIAQRALFKALHEDPQLPMLEVEEHVIRIVESVFRQTTADRSATPRGRERSVCLSARGTVRGRHAGIVEAATVILAREFGSDLSVSDIAERVHCSPGYLSRMFRRITGSTLHAYQLQLRLRGSLQLLTDSRFDFAAIAMQLGFASHSHFTSVFHRQFGITPTLFCRRSSTHLVRRLHAILDENELIRRRSQG